MTKTKVLTEIYLSSEVKEAISKLSPQHLQDDIKQHCFLELFEKSEEFIMDLHERGKLKNYIVKTLYNTAKFTRTTFAKQLGKEIPFSDFDTNKAFEMRWETGDDYIEHSIEQVIGMKANEPADEFENIDVSKNLDNLHWYKREMIKLYAEEGTYQKVSDLTHIPMTSVYQTVLETRKQILKEYYESQRR